MKSPLFPLLVAIAFASAPAAPAAEGTIETIAPGLRHIVIDRGEAASSASYRLLIGEYDSQSEADQMLNRLDADGFAAALDADSKRYRIVIPGLAAESDAEDLKRRLSELGYPKPFEIQEVLHDLANPSGPWKINVLEADPEKIRVQLAHAYDAAIGLETTAELASRLGALAAINGGYFQMEGLLAGDSQGTLRIDGTLYSEPDRGRASVGFCYLDGGVRSVFGRLAFKGNIRLADGEVVPIDGINRERKSSEVILYTPEFHRTTLTPSHGAEIIVEDGQVTELRQDAGSSTIPARGMVLSVGSERVREVLPRFRVGERLTVETDVVPLMSDPEGLWKQADSIVSGGPLLLFNGRRVEEREKESFSQVFCLARHPRTAAGVRADGTLVFVTVDGRQPGVSVGMSIPELTDLMVELGCVSAVNLDGGGSTTMVIDGRTVNRPSGTAGDRRNADAILLFPRQSVHVDQAAGL